MHVRLAISMGDPTGIGPEVIVRALTEEPPDARCVVFGAPEVFEEIARRIGLKLPDGVQWVETDRVHPGALRPGEPDTLAGRLQVRSLEAALSAVLAGEADALCTAPITKRAARAAGFPFPGHTELLAERTGARRHAMMLAGPSLRVVPLTGHVPLAQVVARLDPRRVADGIVVTALGLRDDFAVARPHLAVAGINPHAGEGGMLGEEEQRILEPGIELARQELAAARVEARVSGPLPADAVFVPPVAYDAVICAYHDQALIPLKMLSRDAAVNVTLGLPIVRTSPAHGSALDIAGQGRARAESMRAALALAREIVQRRRAAAAPA